MSREVTPSDQAPEAVEFNAYDWLEAHGMLHERGDGCDHCDGWLARHWPDDGRAVGGRQFTACTDPRCSCVRRV